MLTVEVVPEVVPSSFKPPSTGAVLGGTFFPLLGLGVRLSAGLSWMLPMIKAGDDDILLRFGARGDTGMDLVPPIFLIPSMPLLLTPA